MIEWVIPLAVGATAFIKTSKSEKKKIEHIMKNVGYGVKKKDEILYPKFKVKESLFDGDKHVGEKYCYTVPLGLPATKLAEMEKSVKLFSDGLKRPVEVSYQEGLLQISVYNSVLPTMYPYSTLPPKNDEWTVPMGIRFDGLIWHNFDYVPHMTVAGVTRFGKSVLLKVIMTYLIENHPDDVEFYIIDLKGGLEFGPYENLNQVRGVGSNEEEAAILLDEVHERMQRMYKYFRHNNWSNVVNTPEQKRIFVIVDEAAQLTPEKWMSKEHKKLLSMCQYYLGEIARIGGALGFREIFCTQYPTADTLPRQIKQNADAKVTFRLPTGYASSVAIDDTGAEELPSDIKGRALFKTHELKEMQVPFISDKEMRARLKNWEVRKDGTNPSTSKEKQTREDSLYFR
ncbi:FtsK/SpoIIIE domain-containing protein [Bacillus carboniphilus]|uniref:FtsK/SpoIIIE domain-containing protein n=1 Tax=Bacillus carboniphilus TaxID=86663 RepID=A0ABN0VPB9_9BACI